MRKCSFCLQRIERSKEPACVAKCVTGALTYFPNGKTAGTPLAYGNEEGLHMVFKTEGSPADYALPEPVPLNTTTSLQIWKWLAGVIPGGVLLAWLWKKIED
jgi:hypothetical protein